MLDGPGVRLWCPAWPPARRWRFCDRREGVADLGCRLAGGVEGPDQPGCAKLPGVGASLGRLDGGGRQAGEDFAAFGFGDRGAGFGFVLGDEQIDLGPSCRSRPPNV